MGTSWQVCRPGGGGAGLREAYVIGWAGRGPEWQGWSVQGVPRRTSPGGGWPSWFPLQEPEPPGPPGCTSRSSQRVGRLLPELISHAHCASGGSAAPGV